MSNYRENIDKIQIDDPVHATIANEPHQQLQDNINHVKSRVEAQEGLTSNLIQANNQISAQITLINNKWGDVNSNISSLEALINSVNSSLLILINNNKSELDTLDAEVASMQVSLDSINQAIAALTTSLAGKVNRSGDSMTGNLIFEGNKSVEWDGDNKITGNPSLLEIIAGKELRQRFTTGFSLWSGSEKVEEYADGRFRFYKDINLAGNVVRMSWTDAGGNNGIRSFREQGTNSLVSEVFEGSNTRGTQKLGFVSGNITETLYQTASRYRTFTPDKLDVFNGAKQYTVHFDATNNRMVFDAKVAGDYLRFSTNGAAKFDMNYLQSSGYYVNRSYLDLNMQGNKITNFSELEGGLLRNAQLLWGGGSDHARIHFVEYGVDASWLTLEMGDNPNDRIRYRTSGSMSSGTPHDPIFDIGADGLWSYKNLDMGGRSVLNTDFVNVPQGESVMVSNDTQLAAAMNNPRVTTISLLYNVTITQALVSSIVVGTKKLTFRLNRKYLYLEQGGSSSGTQNISRFVDFLKCCSHATFENGHINIMGSISSLTSVTYVFDLRKSCTFQTCDIRIRTAIYSTNPAQSFTVRTKVLVDYRNQFNECYFDMYGSHYRRSIALGSDKHAYYAVELNSTEVFQHKSCVFSLKKGGVSTTSELATITGAEPMDSTTYKNKPQFPFLIDNTQDNSSMGPPGFCHLPGGLLMQWGSFTDYASSQPFINFPIPFSVAPYYVNITMERGTGNGYVPRPGNLTQNSFQKIVDIWTNVHNPIVKHYWMAIGPS